MPGSSPIANEEQARFWSERSASWLASEERLELVIGSAGLVAIERLGLRAGQRVLDVGCGSGRTTAELARRVMPGGRAVGLDIAAEMVAYASAHTTSEGVEFVQGDAQVHDLGSFDAAFSRFGVMFFADPVAAFANVRRALTPDGVLSFVCWQDVFQNEWMLIPAAAASPVIGTPPRLPDPEAPGPFALASPDRVRAVLGAAGFAEVDIESRNDEVAMPAADIPGFATQSLSVGAIREMLGDADDAMRARVRDAVEEALAAKVVDGHASFARGFHAVRATA